MHDSRQQKWKTDVLIFHKLSLFFVIHPGWGFYVMFDSIYSPPHSPIHSLNYSLIYSYINIMYPIRFVICVAII